MTNQNQTTLWINPLNNKAEFITPDQAQGVFYEEGNADTILSIGDAVLDGEAGVFGFIESFFSEHECLVVGDDGEETVINPSDLSKAR